MTATLPQWFHEALSKSRQFKELEPSPIIAEQKIFQHQANYQTYSQSREKNSEIKETLESLSYLDEYIHHWF